MKTKDSLLLVVITLFVCIASPCLYAFNYNVSFTGSGLSSTVDSVLVTNSYKGISIMIHSGETLVLSDEVSAVDDAVSDNESMCVLTNSLNSKSKLSFYAKNSGNSYVSVFTPDGKKTAEIAMFLQQGRNSFDLTLPGGVFIVQVAGNGYKYVKKLIIKCHDLTQSGIVYTGVSATEPTVSKKNKKAVIKKLLYSSNDNIVFKGISGNYATVSSARPTSDAVINFLV